MSFLATSSSQQPQQQLVTIRTRMATPLTPELAVTRSTLAGVSRAAASSSTPGSWKPELFVSGWLTPEASCGGGKVYRPSRNSSQSRYSTNDWDNFNKAKRRQSMKETTAAEQTRAEAWHTVQVTELGTRIRQSEASRKLSERAQDIECRRQQLAKEAHLSTAETQRLADHLKVLENYLAYTAKPLHISEECLLHREGRTGVDQVHDEVERQLTREVECIRKCQDRLHQMAEKTRTQLNLSRQALHQLNRDIGNKSHARSIDDRMSQLSNHSPSIAFHPGIEKLDNSLSIPDSWVRFSQENIARSHRCRAASEKLRASIEQLLRACVNELWSQFNTVNAAFSARIREVTEVRNGLQAQLQRTIAEMVDSELAIDSLRQAIADKAAPMKLAQTRLEERTRRLDMEICSDPATNALQHEVCALRDSLRALNDRLRSMEAALSRLAETHRLLEADIRVKELSLRIDANLCMAMRRAIPAESKAAISGFAALQHG